MITNYWIEKGVSALLFVVFIFLGYLSFGYPVYFDRLFICLLIALISSYKIDRDLFSIGVLYVATRLIDESLFLIDSSLLEKVGVYVAAALSVSYLKFDNQVKSLVLPVLLICICAEVYWLYIGYEAPHIHYYFALIVVNTFARYMLVFRGHIRLLSKMKLKSLPIDFSLYKLIGASNIVIAAMIIEYIIRHVTHLNPIFVYEAYSYIKQLFSLLTVHIILSHIVKLRNKFLA